MAAHLKIFSSAAHGSDLAALEAAVNEWLEREQPRITRFAQTAHGKELILSFLYEQELAEALTETAATAAEVPPIFEQSLERTKLDPTTESSLLPEAELPY